jgi:hypothetical protein
MPNVVSSLINWLFPACWLAVAEAVLIPLLT